MQQLFAGYARVDVTPDYPVSLGGYGDEERRISQGVLDHIYVTCIAIRQADTTFLLMDADLIGVDNWLEDLIHQRVCPATGVPANHIFCGGTHSHSAPALYFEKEDTLRFREEFLAGALKAAQDALADLAPAEIRTGTTMVKGLNYIRHYLVDNGTYLGSNFGDHSRTCVAHAGEADPRMLLVQFRRADKPHIVMMNWQAHADNAKEVGFLMLSANYPGYVREAFEKESGMHFAFFQGASGNLNPFSKLPQEDHGLDYAAYGQKLAHIALEAMNSLKVVTGDGIRCAQTVLDVAVEHSWDHMLPQANEVVQLWKTVDRFAAYELGLTYNFSSQYQANAIRNRAKLGPSIPMVLNAFRIGDLAFVTCPNEMFSSVGLHVRLYAPYEKVFIMAGNRNYLPDMPAYEIRSYEADTSLYAKGTAEIVADTLVQLLEQIR